MKPQKLLCYLFPVAAGLGTAWLRYTAIDRAVDPGTGIPSSTGWLTAAYGVIAGVLVLLLLYTFLMGKRQGPSPALLGSPVYRVLYVVAGLLFLASAAFAFFSLADTDASALSLVEAIFAIACGLCVLFRLKVQPTSETAGTLLLIPVFYSAYTLLVFYRNNNANPLIYSFATELFAFLAVMFAMYATAAFHFGKRRPRLLRFASMAGIYLLVTVLCSDNLLPFFTKGHLHFDTADLLTMGGFLGLLGAHLFVLVPLPRGVRQD